MRKLIMLFIGMMLISGCATLDKVRTTNRENLMRLSIGITKQEALNIMGTGTVRTGDYPPTVNNPYRSEILQGTGKTFEVLYYCTDIKRADGAITDDELTPLVFDNNKLIGWGWSFLEDNKNKYEIRVR
jgi:hypothetical protein